MWGRVYANAVPAVTPQTRDPFLTSGKWYRHLNYGVHIRKAAGWEKHVNDLKNWLEDKAKWIASVVGLVAITLTALPFDAFGLFSEEITQVRASNVLLIALLTTTFVTLIVREAGIDKKLEQSEQAEHEQTRILRDALDRQSASFREQMERVNSALQEQKAAIGAVRESGPLIEALDATLSNLPDKNAAKLTSHMVPYIMQHVRTIITKKQFTIKGGVFFQEFYRDTFRRLNGPCDIIATALADYESHWDDPELDTLFKTFTSKPDCSLKRIFILESDDVFKAKNVQNLMAAQSKSGVEVYWITRRELTEPLQLLIADKQHTLSWLLGVTQKNAIETVEASWDTGIAGDRYRYAERLLAKAKPFAQKPNTAQD